MHSRVLVQCIFANLKQISKLGSSYRIRSNRSTIVLCTHCTEFEFHCRDILKCQSIFEVIVDWPEKTHHLELVLFCCLAVLYDRIIMTTHIIFSWFIVVFSMIISHLNCRNASEIKWLLLELLVDANIGNKQHPQRVEKLSSKTNGKVLLWVFKRGKFRKRCNHCIEFVSNFIAYVPILLQANLEKCLQLYHRQSRPSNWWPETQNQ